MSNSSWPGITPEAAARRAGGRRRYNAERHDEMLLRRYQVAHLLEEYGVGWGAQARMAEELGVSRATVCRDIAAIFEDRVRPCQTCGTRLRPEEWKRAHRWEQAQWRTA